MRPGYRREVHYVESSPTEQLQPKHYTRDYAKPGDTVDIAQPVLFQVEARKQIDIDERAVSESLRPLAARPGGRTAAASRSNTTSAGTRCIA